MQIICSANHFYGKPTNLVDSLAWLAHVVVLDFVGFPLFIHHISY